MRLIVGFLIGLMGAGCAVGWGKPSEVRTIPISNQQYVITVDGDPLLTTTGKMIEQFHIKARNLCSGGYEIISIREQQGHAGVSSVSLSNVTGTIRCN